MTFVSKSRSKNRSSYLEDVNNGILVNLEVVDEDNEDDDESYDDDLEEGLTEKSFTGDSHSKEEGGHVEIAKQETRDVYKSKLLVMLVLALVTAGFAYSTYKFTAKADYDMFVSDVSIYYECRDSFWYVNHIV